MKKNQYKKRLDSGFDLLNSEQDTAYKSPTLAETTNQIGNNNYGTTVSGTQQPIANEKDRVLKQYKAQLQLDSLNAKNELDVSNRKANEYLNNYLKSQGLLNTGYGASNYVNLASNYSKAMEQINSNERMAMRELEENYQTNRVSELQKLLAATPQNERASKLNEIKLTEGLDSRYLNSLNDYATILNSEESSMKNEEIKKIALEYIPTMNTEQYIDYLNQLENDPTVSQDTKNYVKEIAKRNQVDALSQTNNIIKSLESYKSNASSKEEYKMLLNYEKTLKDAIATGNEKTILDAYNKVYEDISKEAESEIDLSGKDFYTVDQIKPEYFGEFNGSKDSNSKQSKAINNLISYSKQWGNDELFDGVTVNVNYGAGSASYWKYDASTQSWEKTTKQNATTGKTMSISRFYNHTNQELRKLLQQSVDANK